MVISTVAFDLQAPVPESNLQQDIDDVPGDYFQEDSTYTNPVTPQRFDRNVGEDDHYKTGKINYTLFNHKKSMIDYDVWKLHKASTYCRLMRGVR